MEKIIDKINNVGQNYVDTTFHLLPKGVLTYVINGKNISQAINQKKNNSFTVNVLNWFNDFWLYVEIRFVLNKSISKRKKTLPNIFFTLSVFQGKVDKNKTQLFRAEWGNYDDNSDNHPQPHWHIYTQREIEQQFLISSRLPPPAPCLSTAETACSDEDRKGTSGLEFATPPRSSRYAKAGAGWIGLDAKPEEQGD